MGFSTIFIRRPIATSLLMAGVLLLGILGYLLERYGFPLAPVVLGLVLGPIVEKNFMQRVIKTNWDLTQFLTRPISATLMIITILVLAYPLLRSLFQSMRRRS